MRDEPKIKSAKKQEYWKAMKIKVDSKRSRKSRVPKNKDAKIETKDKSRKEDERWKMKDERWKMKDERLKIKDERWKMKD